METSIGCAAFFICSCHKNCLVFVVGGGVKVVEKRRFENPAWVSLE